MKPVIASLVYIYSKLLCLYPVRFHNEFSEEMKIAFRDSITEATEDGILQLASVCLREIIGLPINILREFWFEFERKESGMINDHSVTESDIGKGKNRWDALIGTLPFVLFGIASMIGKLRLPYLGIYAGLVFYVIVLLGLLIGMIKGVPRWTYSYLSWSLVFALWWSNMGTVGLRIFGFRIDHWTWQIWPPFLAAISIAILWTRSLRPIRQLVRGIWQDWILVSFTIYTLFASFLLGYDENRHPYLFLFMTTSTIIFSTSVWFFLRSIDMRKQVLSLLFGFVLAFAVSYICDATWDWHAYYGYPKPPAEAAYVSVLRYVAFLVFYGGILFLPSLLAGMRRTSATEE